MPRQKYTERQIERAKSLREEDGLTYGQIALKVGMNVKSVSWYCLMDGVELPGGKIKKGMPTPPKTYIRNGRTVTRFNDEEDKVMVEMDMKGASRSEIAAALKRNPNSIKARLASLARSESRLEILRAQS